MAVELLFYYPLNIPETNSENFFPSPQFLDLKDFNDPVKRQRLCQLTTIFIIFT